MDKEEIKENQEKGSKKKIENTEESTEKTEKLSPDEKIKELEDKVSRIYAEMENQRRRYEKEKEDAFDYGGFSFAKESLNLIDNLERSKTSLENDEELKNTESLKKIIEHLNIVSRDMLTILKKKII